MVNLPRLRRVAKIHWRRVNSRSIPQYGRPKVLPYCRKLAEDLIHQQSAELGDILGLFHDQHDKHGYQQQLDGLDSPLTLPLWCVIDICPPQRQMERVQTLEILSLSLELTQGLPWHF
jgi:hypothetical protein